MYSRLSKEDEKVLCTIKQRVEEEFFRSRYPNVLGLGVGIKWTRKEPTAEPALIVLVEDKVQRETLRAKECIPDSINGVRTDVLKTGRIASCGILTKRVRPARGGLSVSHEKGTAGTLALCCYGQNKHYILGCNHVLALSNEASLGDRIVQPGVADGGSIEDTLATLSRFVPIDFEPEIKREEHKNKVDAALAESALPDVERGIYWIGPVRKTLPLSEVEVGMPVQKVGRTTGYTQGRITVVDATVDVQYGGGKTARFSGQILTNRLSSGGDSGSLVVSQENQGVGLLFAGSSHASVMNPLAYIEELLQISIV